MRYADSGKTGHAPEPTGKTRPGRLFRQQPSRRKTMTDPKDIWCCRVNNCGFIYDPERGDRRGKIPRATRFEDLPDAWRCPVCGGTKKSFVRLNDSA